MNFLLYVVDDDQTIAEGIAFAFEGRYQVRTFATAEDALASLATASPDMILLDIGLPGMNGIKALAEFKKLLPGVLVVMITAFEETSSVIAAMKVGAHDYIVKPLHMEALEVTVKNALNSIRLRKEVQLLQEKQLVEHVPCFIGESKTFKQTMELVNSVALSPDTPILILGETGTGKEIIARTIHFRSPNFDGPLVTVNCASIPGELTESELFGYEKGAFTGADASGKKGLIEEAAGGTLFLDEVGDLGLAAQAKMLRFLESGEYFRVGSTKSRTVKTRVISATNKDVTKMVEDGSFREDLFYRLGVVKVELPSLKERPEDIIQLAGFFLVEFSRRFKKEFQGFTPEAEQALLNHPWQGNIRELRNLIERGVLVSRGVLLTAIDLGIGPPSGNGSRVSAGASPAGRLAEGAIDLTELLENLERSYIEAALQISKGNESGAARLLGLNHHTFRYRKKKLLEE